MRSIIVCMLALVVSCFQNSFAMEGSLPIKIGAGGQLGMSVFFPSDANKLIDDFWDYYSKGFGDKGTKPIGFIVGLNGQIKGTLQVAGMVRGELWFEEFTGNSVWMEYKEEGYSTWEGSYKFEESNYFWPSYWAPGMNILLTPGTKDGILRFNVGGGLGYYHGRMDYKYEGKYESDSHYYENWHNESFSRFTGHTLGVNGQAGITVAPIKFLELDLTFMLRYAKIKHLEADEGHKFKNFDGTEEISLDFSGMDFRLGLRAVL